MLQQTRGRAPPALGEQIDEQIQRYLGPDIGVRGAALACGFTSPMLRVRMAHLFAILPSLNYIPNVVHSGSVLPLPVVVLDPFFAYFEYWPSWARFLSTQSSVTLSNRPCLGRRWNPSDGAPVTGVVVFSVGKRRSKFECSHHGCDAHRATAHRRLLRPVLSIYFRRKAIRCWKADEGACEKHACISKGGRTFFQWLFVNWDQQEDRPF